MLTPAEIRSLALTLALLAAGAGAKIWQRAQTRLGPFEENPSAAATPGSPSGPAADAPAAAAPADPGAPAGDAASAPSPATGPESHRHDQERWLSAREPDPSGTGASAPRASAAPGGPAQGGGRHGRSDDRRTADAGGSHPAGPRPARLERAATAEAGAGYALLGVSTGVADPAGDPFPPPADPGEPRLPDRRAEETGGAGSARSRGGGGVAARNAPKKGGDVKVHLNRASAAELAQVPGIGEKTAKAILDYRKARGPILDLRELLNVKGIGEKKLERMAPCLILSPMRDEEPLRQAARPAE